MESRASTTNSIKVKILHVHQNEVRSARTPKTLKAKKSLCERRTNLMQSENTNPDGYGNKQQPLLNYQQTCLTTLRYTITSFE